MSKQVVFICDRCDCKQAREIKLSVVQFGDIPQGWQILGDTMICDQCGCDLEAFLRGARIEQIAVDRSEKAEASV